MPYDSQYRGHDFVQVGAGGLMNHHKPFRGLGYTCGEYRVIHHDTICIPGNLVLLQSEQRGDTSFLCIFGAEKGRFYVCDDVVTSIAYQWFARTVSRFMILCLVCGRAQRGIGAIRWWAACGPLRRAAGGPQAGAYSELAESLL